MKKTTEEIILNLRHIGLPSDEKVADRLEELLEQIDELKRDNEGAEHERTRACVEKLSFMKERDEARAEVKRLEIINEEVLQANYTMATSRPEPSRLEIAAMLLGAQPPPQAGSFKGQAEHALRRADALIAAAKEVTK